MIWRFLAPVFVRHVFWVTAIGVGLVVMAVTLERGGEGTEALGAALQLHIAVALVWLGPLFCAVGLCLSRLRLKSRGELLALSVSGVGWPTMGPIIVVVGAVVGVCGLAVGEWWLPTVSSASPPAWLWTDTGLLRSANGQHLHRDGGVSYTVMTNALLQRASPRMAPLTVLHWSGGVAEMTEILARVARIFGCIGFSLMGFLAARRPHGLGVVTGIAAILLVTEAVVRTMGAQGRLSPIVAGTVGGWMWVVPALWLWCQPSTRIHRPE